MRNILELYKFIYIFNLQGKLPPEIFLILTTDVEGGLKSPHPWLCPLCLVESKARERVHRRVSEKGKRKQLTHFAQLFFVECIDMLNRSAAWLDLSNFAKKIALI